LENDLKKRTWAEVRPANIAHNYHAIRKTLPEGCRFLGVVKADAYGHGALQVARLLEKEGADYLAVACLDEAMELRKGGIKMPILILGSTPPQYTEALVNHNITQATGSLEMAKEYSEACSRLGKTLKIHIKTDTGMSRLGFVCEGEHFKDAAEKIAEVCRLPGLDAEGIFTHFAVSDEEGEVYEAYTRGQYALFLRIIDELDRNFGIRFAIRHCANSGAVLNYPEMALDMVRPGLLLYGYGDGKNKLGLLPGMRLVTTVAAIKQLDSGVTVSYGRHYTTENQSRIGVLAIGYADGLHRASSGKAEFWTGKHLIRQCGNICMDMCMVDLTDCPEVQEGSEIEVFGEHARLEKLAENAGTIPYELLCSVSKRVPRITVTT